ncbi:MAG: ATP-binding protein [Planctomycetota bacterium]|jgi:signal transduction histidine kinase
MSDAREFGDTGLGLSISKRLVQILGGDVTLVETANGIGSTFRIRIATGRIDPAVMTATNASVPDATNTK